MTRSPAVILYDADGNPAGLVADGLIYRLQTEAKLASGHGLALNATLADVLDDTSRIPSAQHSGAALSNVTASASSVTLLNSNTSRLGAVIVNDSVATLYVKFGSSASSTSYTYVLPPAYTLELQRGPVYTGIITGIWTAASGAARVTELT